MAVMPNSVKLGIGRAVYHQVANVKTQIVHLIELAAAVYMGISMFGSDENSYSR